MLGMDAVQGPGRVWIITVHFCVSAIPVIVWQVWLDTRLQEEANGHAA